MNIGYMKVLTREELMSPRHVTTAFYHKHADLYDLFDTGYLVTVRNKTIFEVSSKERALCILGSVLTQEIEHYMYKGKESFGYTIAYAKSPSSSTREALLVDVQTGQVFVMLNKYNLH